MFSSTNLLISASTLESTGSDFSVAAEDVGAFISFSTMWIGCLIRNPNDISSRVNNCLGFFFNKQLIRRLRGAPLLPKVASTAEQCVVPFQLIEVHSVAARESAYPAFSTRPAGLAARRQAQCKWLC
jgi:hypothetical protein